MISKFCFGFGSTWSGYLSFRTWIQWWVSSKLLNHTRLSMQKRLDVAFADSTISLSLCPDHYSWYLSWQGAAGCHTTQSGSIPKRGEMFNRLQMMCTLCSDKALCASPTVARLKITPLLNTFHPASNHVHIVVHSVLLYKFLSAKKRHTH